MTPSRLFLRRALTLLAVLTAACAMPMAYADLLQDAGKLLRQGQTKQALEQVDKYLSTSPKDASGRFLRAVVLTEMGRTGEAIGIFTKLTEDYPDLPEPYNNLAVIYAQQKQYEKARIALEAAIRTHPAYATAHENLGDIYARLASQAYDKALQLDSANKTAQTKLSMIRSLITASARTATPMPPSAPPAVAAPPTTVVEKPAAPPTSVASVESRPAPPPVAQPKVAETEKPAPKAVPETSTPDDVAKVLASWADAWSRKDAKAYLAFYASDFKTPSGMSRAAWAAERTRRVTKPGRISVTIEGARVTPEGADKLVVKFRQHYKSTTLSASSNKTLLLTRQNGQWKILQERIGS